MGATFRHPWERAMRAIFRRPIAATGRSYRVNADVVGARHARDSDNQHPIAAVGPLPQG